MGGERVKAKAVRRAGSAVPTKAFYELYVHAPAAYKLYMVNLLML